MSYYECHITMLGDKEQIRRCVEATGWKFSAIDGDPVLGAGVKCYATMFYNQRVPEYQVQAAVRVAANELTEAGIQVTRRKVELVIFDDRSDKVNCNGACPECVS